MSKTSFKDYQLSEDLLKAINILGFENPTGVQEQVIPAILEKKDIIVKSQTGSGKTAAFAIPICELVDWEENKPQALVLTPTRELAVQVKEDIFNLGRYERIKVAAVYGKSPFYIQEKELKQKTHVVVGTPGRIIDHLEKETLDTSMIKYLIIDEADEMLSMGFIEQIENIINRLPKDRVTALLSATMPKDIDNLCKKHIKNPIRVEIEESNPVEDRIYQVRYEVETHEKTGLLKDMLVVENPDSAIIFCNTQQKVEDIYSELKNLNYTCDKIHGAMEQCDRLKVMKDFKQGYFRYLVATDVAARGIDIDNVSLVVNYDIPKESERYVHRIGRTGRIGREGRAITFSNPFEGRFLKDIVRLIGKEIPLSQRPDKDTIESYREQFIAKTKAQPKLKETKGAQLNKEILKLHINAGKRTKMRPVDIVGTLCNIEGMTAKDIGVINIVDISTYVEILNNKGELVYRELQTKNIKGRLRKVSKVILQP
jgi:superfamily II DNA/RNA helicase